MRYAIRFHAKVSRELKEILEHYENEAGTKLADDFYHELMEKVEIVATHPTYFPQHAEGVRRANLKRFPYHFLYRIRLEFVWIFVLRHDSRHPNYGTRRH